eukprot:TRINITY_DN662_c0_g1_i1.p1 TRINITY_DN662_c0_g1~~TRINITY_DN662_c0_g1_i1.p1  ORF type:complete len:323 (+),score=-27.64 TRINITY_DN662_c0_g1_i1:259-1227(+)
MATPAVKSESVHTETCLPSGRAPVWSRTTCTRDHKTPACTLRLVARCLCLSNWLSKPRSRERGAWPILPQDGTPTPSKRTARVTVTLSTSAQPAFPFSLRCDTAPGYVDGCLDADCVRGTSPRRRRRRPPAQHREVLRSRVEVWGAVGTLDALVRRRYLESGARHWPRVSPASRGSRTRSSELRVYLGGLENRSSWCCQAPTAPRPCEGRPATAADRPNMEGHHDRRQGKVVTWLRVRWWARRAASTVESPHSAFCVTKGLCHDLWFPFPVLCVDTCLLYTSDAADEEDSVDLGGRRIIKKKKKNNICSLLSVNMSILNIVG